MALGERRREQAREKVMRIGAQDADASRAPTYVFIYVFHTLLTFFSSFKIANLFCNL